MLKDLSVRDMLHETASSSPAPGGGSIAALAGAQGGALLVMYCRLSQNREKYGDSVDLLQQVEGEALTLIDKLLSAVDDDTAAFNRVMAAYRMPKENDQQKKARKKSIQSATTSAAEVPLLTAVKCANLLSLISKVAGKGNPSAITDLGVANLQALAGLEGACYNVRINLETLVDQRKVEDLNNRVAEVLKQARILFQNNQDLVEKAIPGYR